MQGVPGGQWRGFLRAMADEIDATMPAAQRERLLRGIGRRMAGMMPLPAASSLETLEIEMNDALASFGWGSVRFDLLEQDHCLLLNHAGLPRLGSAGDPPGTWLAATLEGLYEGWLAQQPGSEPSLTARIDTTGGAGTITLRYGRN